ncbi:uncharacterized protein TNCV_3071481 [Trichonephila clavipes]|nr:uncharacterized protein TNCV_3071481 [Trichonephila clavipes]
MESEGALRIFSRSLPNYNVRYVQYLGDGDSKGFLRVQESNIYGDEFPVEKEDGSKTESPKEQFKIHQAVRQQTDIWMRKADRCRNSSAAKYYGLAIRRNVGKSVADMSKSIWAIYFINCRQMKNPQHALCPMGEESWCGYNKSIVSGEKYTHKHSLPDAVLFKLKNF